MENQQNNHKTWWDEKNEIIRIQVLGDFSGQDAEGTANKIAEIKDQFPDKKLGLLVGMELATTPSSQARKIIVEKIYKDPTIEKIATVSQSLIVRTINNFLAKASGLKEVKVEQFPTEEEALKWLKE